MWLRRLRLALSLLPAIFLLAGFRVARVGDEDMAPSLLPGDWVLLGPGDVDPGDVWLLDDPAEPARAVLRRVMAVGGQEARWKDGRFYLDGETPKIREMGRSERGVVLAEGNRWLVRIRSRPTPADSGGQLLSEGQVWLMADERDWAVDSRSWGPLPEDALRRELWARWGSKDEWRGSSTWGSADGPWHVPPPKELSPPEGRGE